MLAIKLAIRNLIGAGLRTWLNISVLSVAYLIIIFHNGIIDGWNLQARNDTQAWEIGQGQLWHENFDPLDVFTYQDAHSPISKKMSKLIKQQKVTPILLTQASAYPQGRMQSILLKGIIPNQKIVKLPSAALSSENEIIKAIIGKQMAKNLKLKKGENLLIRWRDKNGTFDAIEIEISEIFDCDVPGVDNGKIWISLANLQKMINLENQASYFIVNEKYKGGDFEKWKFKTTDFLLADLNQIIEAKRGSGMVFYGLLLLIALLAIFDTQVLSIFRRQKEIGTYIALGMTRWQVVKIFTVEGSMYSILAAILAAICGSPLFWSLSKSGLAMPAGTNNMNIAISERIFPSFSIELIVSTLVFVVLAATIVSFLPASKIAKLKPTDALKGKIQ